MIVLFRGAEVADATATLAFEVVDIANKAVNEGLDSMKRKGGLKGWLAKRLIA
ncbi:MAG: hypothetical protein R3251_02770 [Candidatus Spechtbacterales bacterium]|nr:hypothetical protein [Candidatus Spechtbacterales bacterium]